MVRKTNYDMEVKRQNQEKRFYFYPDEVVNTSFGYHLPGGRSLGILDLHRRQAGTICGTFVQHKSGQFFSVLFVFLRFATNCDKNVANLAFRDKNVVNLAFCDKNVTI